MRPDLIYTLDDIGLSPSIDTEIVEKVLPTTCNRTSLIVGLYDTTPLLPWLARVPALDIHLNATKKTVRHTQKKLGTFSTLLSRLFFIIMLLANPFRQKQIVASWEKQIILFHQIVGRYPDGINSHEHVHVYPPLFKEVLRLAQKYNIPFVRLGAQMLYVKKTLRDHIYELFIKRNLQALHRTPLQTSSALHSADGLLTSSFEETLPPQTEVILHPDIQRDREKIGLV